MADTLRPYAEQTIATAEEARRAVQSAVALESGTIRFGMFGAARLYAGAQIIADVLDRYPGVRVELIGQHSNEVQEQLRRGRLEAALIAVTNVESEGMTVTPVARDELVYISAHPERLTSPVTAARLSKAELVMPETTWRATDAIRILLRQFLHEAGHNPPTRIEVEEVETAVDLVGRGYGDSVIARGAAEQLLPRMTPHVGFVSLRPKLYDVMAIVHRTGAVLSPAAQVMIELATKHIQAITEPV